MEWREGRGETGEGREKSAGVGDKKRRNIQGKISYFETFPGT